MAKKNGVLMLLVMMIGVILLLNIEQTEGKGSNLLASIAKGMQTTAAGYFEHIHEYPELSWQEVNTMAFVQQMLAPYVAYQQKDPQWFTLTLYNDSIPVGGLWYDLTLLNSTSSGGDGTRIIFRADMDALPIQEDSGLPYSSRIAGVCHCDGHDIHTAVLMGTIASLVQNRTVLGPMLTRNIRFVFQRAEEVTQGLSGGHSLVLHSSVLDGIAAGFALHVAGGSPPSFQSKAGNMMARSDWFNLTFQCNGGHVGSPNLGTNCLRVTNAVQNSLSTFAARFLPPGTAISLEPAQLWAGTTSNIMPAAAFLVYSSRTFLATPFRDQMWADIRSQVAAVVAEFNNPKMGYQASFQMAAMEGDPPLANAADLHNTVTQLLRQAGELTVPAITNMGGEDFAYYLLHMPGYYSFWGLGGSGHNHSPQFAPNEQNIWHGIRYWLLLATSPNLLSPLSLASPLDIIE